MRSSLQEYVSLWGDVGLAREDGSADVKVPSRHRLVAEQVLLVRRAVFFYHPTLEDMIQGISLGPAHLLTHRKYTKVHPAVCMVEQFHTLGRQGRENVDILPRRIGRNPPKCWSRFSTKRVCASV